MLGIGWAGQVFEPSLVYFYPNRDQAICSLLDFYPDYRSGISPQIYPDSAEALAKILPHFYPDMDQALEGVSGGPV